VTMALINGTLKPLALALKVWERVYG